MKQETSELVRKAQEEALIYARKLSKGEIHLLPEEPDAPTEQKSTEDEQQRK